LKKRQKKVSREKLPPSGKFVGEKKMKIAIKEKFSAAY
jgi:hypothetical protein